MNKSPAWKNNPEGLTLLEGAKLSPEEPSGRLALSDWLEEQGEQVAAQTLRRSLEKNSWVLLPQNVAERFAPVTHFHQGWPARSIADSELATWLKVPPSPWVASIRLSTTSSTPSSRPGTIRLPNLSSNPSSWLTSWLGMIRLPNLSIHSDIKRLVDSVHFSSLVSLEFWNRDRDGDLFLDCLANSTSVSKLAFLDLWSNSLTPRGISQLAQSPCLTNLVYLLLCRNSIGDEVTKALAQSPHLTKLQTLYLGQNGISAKGAEALANSPRLASLVSLDLWENAIGDAGACALANSPYLTKLTFLGLDRNLITDVGASQLAHSPYRTNLKTLSFKDNQIENSTLSLLRERFERVEM
ncbi:MAG: hypothetical protein SNJ75_14115 [Gemmataceae bacterium]